MCVSCALWLSFAAVGHACTLMWNPPTTYTDGTAISELLSYRVYFTPAGSSIATKVADVAVPTVVLTCAVGSYYVTAYGQFSLESAKSNTIASKQLAVPTNLQRTD